MTTLHPTMPHYADDWLTVYQGDCREVLPTLADASVNCVVTSPPYWGLRDYGTATWIGGDEGCDHSAGSHAWATATEQAKKRVDSTMPFRGVCGRCGASRVDSQLGLEATPEEYVANLVAVFREVRRVLRDDGTVWLNLGDSYYAITATQGRNENRSEVSTLARHGEDGRSPALDVQTSGSFRRDVSGLKPKDLVGIPWRVAFALQADGWWLRSDIIWSKPNPMPESVTDRPTKAHEYLFLLSKRERYYYDQEAVAERSLDSSLARYAYADGNTRINKGGAYREAWNNGDKHIGVPTVPDNPAKRNLRSVWTIATRPYPGAHFAVFPPELPERCIKAGCPPEEKRCDCDEPILTPLGSGARFDPSLETGRAGLNRPRGTNEGVRAITRREQRAYAGQMRESPQRRAMEIVCGPAFAHYIRTDESGARPLPPELLADFLERGWLTVPDPCRHPIEPAGVVLDPFAGSGTVGLVANRLSRRAILIDLNPAYISQQMKRNAQVPAGLTA